MRKKSVCTVICLCVSVIIFNVSTAANAVAQDQKKTSVLTYKKQVFNFDDLAITRDQRISSIRVSGYVSQVAQLNNAIVTTDSDRTSERNRSPGSGSGSSYSSNSSSDAVYTCTVQCRGSLYATGARVEHFRVNGKNQDNAAENARDEAGKSVCKGGGKGDFSRAWWADVVSCAR